MAKLTGKVLFIYPTQQLTAKSGNAFSKRDFVLAVQSFDRDTGEPTIDTENTPQLSLTNDRCSQLDNIAVGQIVTPRRSKLQAPVQRPLPKGLHRRAYREEAAAHHTAEQIPTRRPRLLRRTHRKHPGLCEALLLQGALQCRTVHHHQR